ncbi:hypothetical protein F0562_009403 [Nyssa sinensis]|uniref:K-box domain-containing protein n=1 Tax=Nyssa sinensis TaxID=561372 RepID=A0A5J4ZXE4_9ASTE|nr:hypothetical protein F0562_009403 [Nyssa sinensis]
MAEGKEFIGSASVQCIHTHEVSLKEEMTKHAPLYGVGLEDLSLKELETLSKIHEDGLKDIHALQQQKHNLGANPPMSPNTFSNSHRHALQ